MYAFLLTVMVAAGVTTLMAANEDSTTNQRPNPSSRYQSHIAVSQCSNKSQVSQSSVDSAAKKSTKSPSSCNFISEFYQFYQYPIHCL